MSQRKAKEYRRAMEQYQGVAEDVDNLKLRIGAMEARHRRIKLEEIHRRQARREAGEKREATREEYREQMRRINAEKRRRKIAQQRIAVLIAGALVVVLLLALAIKAMTADTAAAEELEITATCGPVTLLTAEPDVWNGEGEDPMEAEKSRRPGWPPGTSPWRCLCATNTRTICGLTARPMGVPIPWPWLWQRLKATLTWRPWAPLVRWGSCS